MNMLADPLIKDLILWPRKQIKDKLKWKIRRQTCEAWFGMRFTYIENWSRQSLEQATFPGPKNFPSYRRYDLLSLNRNPVYWNGQTFIFFTDIWFYWNIAIKSFEVWIIRIFHGREMQIEKIHLRVTQTTTTEPRHDKTCLREFPTRPDTNQPVQPQKLARVLKFRL